MTPEEMAKMDSASADSLDLPMSRNGSGTAWQPDSTPMYARGFSLGDWSLMAHGLAFGGYDYQGSRRGGGQVLQHQLGDADGAA